MNKFKMTDELVDAWNCVLLGMGMMPEWWMQKLEIYYRLKFEPSKFHDEFFKGYDDTRALLYIRNRFRSYVGQLRDIGLPKRWDFGGMTA